MIDKNNMRDLESELMSAVMSAKLRAVPPEQIREALDDVRMAYELSLEKDLKDVDTTDERS